MLLAVSKATLLNYECIPRIASGLAGGMGGQGEMCGAVSGGVLAIGLLFGPDQVEDATARAEIYSKAGAFVQRFVEVNGALRCIDIIGMDVSTIERVQEYYSRNLKEETCSGVVRNAVQVFLDLWTEWENEN